MWWVSKNKDPRMFITSLAVIAWEIKLSIWVCMLWSNMWKDVIKPYFAIIRPIKDHPFIVTESFVHPQFFHMHLNVLSALNLQDNVLVFSAVLSFCTLTCDLLISFNNGRKILIFYVFCN